MALFPKLSSVPTNISHLKTIAKHREIHMKISLATEFEFVYAVVALYFSIS